VITENVPNLHLATLITAIMLLALPALCLGMVAPYVIRLRLNALADSGSVIGRLYALSTMGSIVGAFLGGFVLVSWFSSTMILFGTALCMMALSFLALARPYAGRIILLTLVISAAVWSGFAPPFAGQPRIIETQYNTIQIIDGHLNDTTRLMRFMITDPGSCQSAVYVDNPSELALSYLHFYTLGKEFVPQARRILMLGGGGYGVPRWLLDGAHELNNDELRLDVVEIDPGITQVSIVEFGIPDDARLRIIHQDARVFLNANFEIYDLIFVDLFNSAYSIPFHVGTVEAMARMRRATDTRGAVIMNVISAMEGEGGHLFQAIYQAIAANFAQTHVFAVRDAARRNEVQNVMILAFPEKRPDLATLFENTPPDVRGEARTFFHMLARHIKPPITVAVPPLTDEYAPVERYMLSILDLRAERD
jgi:spermidine synthase